MERGNNTPEVNSTLKTELEKLDDKIAAAGNLDLKRELRLTQSVLKTCASATAAPPGEKEGTYD